MLKRPLHVRRLSHPCLCALRIHEQTHELASQWQHPKVDLVGSGRRRYFPPLQHAHPNESSVQIPRTTGTLRCSVRYYLQHMSDKTIYGSRDIIVIDPLTALVHRLSSCLNASQYLHFCQFPFYHESLCAPKL